MHHTILQVRQLLVDASASMELHREDILDTIADHLADYQLYVSRHPKVRHLAGLTFFNTKFAPQFFMVTPGQIPEITEADYQPEGDTELFDALSFQIDQIEAALNATGDREQAIIQLYLLSDGVDTGSNIVRFADLRARIEALQSTGKWHFHFNLTDLDTIELNALLGLRRELAETTSGPALRAALLDFLTPNDSAIQPTGSTSPSADVTSKNH